VGERFSRVEAETLFLRAPAKDWPKILAGDKTEFRHASAQPWKYGIPKATKTPTPVVLYGETKERNNHRLSRRAFAMGILLDFYVEPVIGVADRPESIQREGFEDFATFRRYWRGRNEGKFHGMQEVCAFQIRLFHMTDSANLGIMLLYELYGHYLNDKYPTYL
jgi:hypothetical protein